MEPGNLRLAQQRRRWGLHCFGNDHAPDLSAQVTLLTLINALCQKSKERGLRNKE